jgi:hypothetical protein
VALRVQVADPGVQFGHAVIVTITGWLPLIPVTLTVWFPDTLAFPLDEVALPTKKPDGAASDSDQDLRRDRQA